MPAGLPVNLERVGRVAGRLTWQPPRGPGARSLSVQLASNHKSVGIVIERTSSYLEHIPRATFAPISRNALELAKKYSSGTFSREAQRAFARAHGYGPYSRRRAAQANDYIINRQTGRLYRGWRRRETGGSGTNALQMALYNVARTTGGFNYPLALFTGTVKMRPRPLPQKVYEGVYRDLDRELNKWRMRLRRGWKGRPPVTPNG